MYNKNNLQPVSCNLHPALPRILMIISLFHPVVGGTEKQAQRLAKKLKEQGINVFMLTREVKGSPDIEEIEGITVYRKIKTIEFGILWGICYIFSTLFFLIRLRPGRRAASFVFPISVKAAKRVAVAPRPRTCAADHSRPWTQYTVHAARRLEPPARGFHWPGTKSGFESRGCGPEDRKAKSAASLRLPTEPQSGAHGRPAIQGR